MGNLKYSVICRWVVRRQARNEVLYADKLHHFASSLLGTYVHEGVPSFPEVAVGYHTNRVSKLVLNVRWYRDHEPNELLFNRCGFILRKLVVPFLILRTCFSICGRFGSE